MHGAPAAGSPAPDAFADPRTILEVSEGLEALGEEATRGRASGPAPVRSKPRSPCVLSGHRESAVGFSPPVGRSPGRPSAGGVGEEGPPLLLVFSGKRKKWVFTDSNGAGALVGCVDESEAWWIGSSGGALLCSKGTEGQRARRKGEMGLGAPWPQGVLRMPHSDRSVGPAWFQASKCSEGSFRAGIPRQALGHGAGAPPSSPEPNGVLCAERESLGITPLAVANLSCR